MTMQMTRAFNPRFMSPLYVIKTTSGYYDENNDYVEGEKTKKAFKAVVMKGNRFSQFDEAVGLQSTVGGQRFTDYRTVYVPRAFSGIFTMNDLIVFNCTNFHIMQKGDEAHFGFTSYLIERTTKDEHNEGVIQ